MSTSTFVISYAYTVTYLTDKMLFLLKEIIRDIGLDPSKFASDWATLRRRRPHMACQPPSGTRSGSKFMIPRTTRSSPSGTSMWSIRRSATARCGSMPPPCATRSSNRVTRPSSCRYDIKVINKPGRRTCRGGRPCELRSTEGFKRYAVGSAVGGNGLSAEVAYWSR